ncbi:hypothetical protein FA15DRAFT_736109 [Coprinopsis marcescibilis]|uniref:Uncharacterized protein n=1 Tax=Coprinopsis marcescibilis TaxID=230819 RepID=A0A5C3KBC3_COPMA|nr:hypothetical protein FA15DRAFT_736109 [Coprinopsis marcescibilis]
MSWLNYSLINYAAKKNILPNTQVAAQPGVQTRDLMSFLAGIKTWSLRNKKPVYAVKRDQMKGFDYLSPDGFYDAVRAYGLPESINDIDRAAQTDTKCFIKTAYGITQPITVSGVNKQGGALSPLKSTFTTSMGHYYLHDVLSDDPDALRISSTTHQQGDPHTPEDSQTLLVSMVEATDDSYIFSTSQKSLLTNTLQMERFQTKVDDPASRFEELKEIIETFQFPTIIGRLPITLARKIVAQNIVSRCRALLYLQPIKQNDAESLDKLIIRRVHQLTGFPFSPNTEIATLPISALGLGFPSIARINAGIALNGINHDLNHHLYAYRTLAQITLNDWMCEKNNCIYPFDGAGLKRDMSLTRNIPQAWIIAHKILKEHGIAIRRTDQSSLLSGDTSVSHIVKLTQNPTDANGQSKSINGTGLRSLCKSGILSLGQVGIWKLDPDGRVRFRCNDMPDNGLWATDGSMNPASAGILDNKTVTAAVVGPKPLAMRIVGTNVSILQGEVMGLIASSILSGCSSGGEDITILTDHLNSVRLLADSKTAIKYTPGHSSEDTTEARMNNEADSLATASNCDIWTVPAPIPTFEMNPYTLYHQKDGWIESDIANYIDLRMTRRTSTKLGTTKGLRMATWAHNSTAPPEFPYTKAISAYSATVQLYTRSGQLPIAETLYQRGEITKDTCRLGCMETETMPHLFVECRQYEALRAESTRIVMEKTRAIICEYPVEDLDKENLTKTAECLFRHEPQIWPLGSSMFYLGQTPPIKITAKISEVTKKKINSALTTEWHIASIRLAGRIFGDYQRRMAKLNCPRPDRT